MMGGGMGLLGFGGIGMILFWVVLIGIVVLVVRSFLGNNSAGNKTPAPTSQTPLEILQTRYAKGEISKEEYEEVQQTL
jgi:putative membrane protein